ncbi:UNVERIFIED_CONTAM: RsiV family protein [Ralstonia mannitolilytica]
MKNLIVISGIALLSITGCKKAESHPTVEKEMYTIDSLNITDTIKITDSLSLIYSSKQLYFPFVKNINLLSSIYFRYKDSVGLSKAEIKVSAEKEMLKLYDQLRGLDKAKTLNGLWVYKNEMQVKFLLHQYMHIQYTDTHYEGSIVKQCIYRDKMFDLKNNKEMVLSDITSISKGFLLAILKKNMYKVFFNIAGDLRINEFDERIFKMNGLREIPNADNFYFDTDGLYFHYNPYELVSSSSVDFVIPISWDQLEGTLTPEFKQRMNMPKDK